MRVISSILLACFLVACDSSQKQESVFGVSPGGAIKQDGVIRPKVGDIVPDFELYDRHGRLFRLSEFKDNIVFLNFWATWCPPCIEELPSMDALNHRLRTRRFTMIAVSVDDNWDDITRFLGRLTRDPSFLILHDPGKLVATELYGSEKFPETYIIGPDRRLLAKHKGALNWAQEESLQQIESLFSVKTE